nr:hypothetical protein [bacterium]
DPSALKIATTFTFFGLDNYDTLERSKANQRQQANVDRFERLFDTASCIHTEAGQGILPIVNHDDRNSLRELFIKYYVPILDSLFDQSSIAKCHHEAVGITETWVRQEGNSSVIDTWDMILCGGEGLFGQVKQSKSTRAGPYKRALGEIEDKFREYRRGTVRAAWRHKCELTDSQIERAYSLYDTVASQTGIAMALSKLIRKMHEEADMEADERVENVCDIVRSISIEQWLAFFNSFEKLYFSNLETNSWPRFQKLFIRCFCRHISTFGEKPKWSPDYEMVVEAARVTLEGRAAGGASLAISDVDDALSTAIAKVRQAFVSMNITIIDEAVLKSSAHDPLLADMENIARRQSLISDGISANGLPVDSDGDGVD